jgi:flagellar hook assembly protein FlgD
MHYDLPTETPVRIVIYDAAGRYVTTLVDEPAQAPGRHEAIWDGRSAGGESVASGVYFCRMESGDFREVRKMALVR